MLQKLIFGVPHDPATAAIPSVVEPQALPKFLPESQLTANQIAGVGDDGDVWTEWRVDGSGQRWFRRVSADTTSHPASIHGFASEPEDDTEPEPDDNGDVLDHFRREVSILEARRDRGEITATDDEDSAHTHLEQLAESLIGQPCYVLLATDGADFGSEHVGGTYAPRLDLLAKGFLEGTGRWQGRRPAVFIDDAYCSPMQVHATLLHELAHVADVGFSGQPEDEISEAAMSLTRLTYAQGVSMPIESVEFDERHSARFVRGCLHLWHRFVAAGYWCSPDLLWEGSAYGAPEPIEANMALGGEPNRLTQLCVGLIVTLPAPAAFDELFA